MAGDRASYKNWANVAFSVAFCFCAVLGSIAHAQDGQPVELELVLAVDTSVSVDSNEFALQMQGLAHAFRDPSVVSAIQRAGKNGIAVALVQWAVGLQQRVTVDWAHVHDADSADALATSIEANSRHFTGNGTGITRTLKFASELFDQNAFQGRRKVIDISSDGRNNSGAHPAQTRDRITASGIVINGLAILDGDLLLGTYFAQNIIGGADSFVMTANSFEDYADAIRMKLLREVSIPIAMTPRDACGHLCLASGRRPRRPGARR